MGSKYWIKLYHEVLSDSKMGRLTHKQWRRTIEVFLMAGEMDCGGLLPSLYDMSYQLRISEEETLADLKELAEFGIVRYGNDCWGVVNFAKRQAASSNAERTKRHRERQRKATAWLQDPVLDEDRDRDRDRDRDIESDTNTDSDEDTEQITEEDKEATSLQISDSDEEPQDITEKAFDKPEDAVAVYTSRGKTT